MCGIENYKDLPSFNPLPEDKISDWSKLKAFADDKLNFTQNIKVVFHKIENIVGKEENAGYQHFLLFPQCFQKAFFSSSVSKVIKCHKGLNPEKTTVTAPKDSKLYNTVLFSIDCYLHKVVNLVDVRNHILQEDITMIILQPITRQQILASSKLIEFADDNFKFDENGRKLSKQVENTVGKGEIAHYKQFLLFPQCFQKVSFLGAAKCVIV